MKIELSVSNSEYDRRVLHLETGDERVSRTAVVNLLKKLALRDDCFHVAHTFARKFTAVQLYKGTIFQKKKYSDLPVVNIITTADGDEIHYMVCRQKLIDQCSDDVYSEVSAFNYMVLALEGEDAVMSALEDHLLSDSKGISYAQMILTRLQCDAMIMRVPHNICEHEFVSIDLMGQYYLDVLHYFNLVKIIAEDHSS